MTFSEFAGASVWATSASTRPIITSTVPVCVALLAVVMLGERFGSRTVVSLILAVLGIMAVMLWLDWRLALTAFAVIPALFLVTNWFRRGSRRSFREVRRRPGIERLCAVGSQMGDPAAPTQLLCCHDWHPEDALLVPRMVDVLETNGRYTNLSPYGEPQLGRERLRREQLGQ